MLANEELELRKPEVAETRALLAAATNERDAKKTMDAIQRVLSYSNLGVDMSPLYAEMIKSCNTRDLTQKKLVYMYLSEYAQRNSEMALLAVNTLRKDALDMSPLVRGLALRAIGNLRLANLVEYLLPPVLTGLKDAHPYVRKTAALAAGKLSTVIHRDAASSEDLFEAIKLAIQCDDDPQVVLNAIHAMRVMESTYNPGKAVVAKLISRLRELGEWSQCQVLELLCSVASQLSPEEVVGIMNGLDERLQDNNSAVVMAVAKAFLRITASTPDIHRQVYLRIKSPLLLIVQTAVCPEVIVPVLSHLKLCLTRFPDLLESDFSHFFVRQNDPTYLKVLKVELLTLVASERNAPNILDELIAYVTDLDALCTRKSLEAMGRIAIKLPPVVREIACRLVELLELNDEAVSSGVILVIKDLIRKYPVIAKDVLPPVVRIIDQTEDPEAKSAIVWMLGEHGQIIDDAPYILEDLADLWDAGLPLPVKLQATTAAVKLLLKRPVEAVTGAGRILSAAAADDCSSDLRDRAVMYYSLLSMDAEQTKTVVCGGAKEELVSFPEHEDFALQDRLWDEFNSISVTLGKPRIDRPQLINNNDNSNSKADENPTDDVDDDQQQQQQHQQPQQVHEQQETPKNALIDIGQPQSVEASLDALLGVKPDAAVASVDEEEIKLVGNPMLTPAEFQKTWGSLSVCEKRTKTMREGTVEPFVAKMKALTSGQVRCIASGIVNGTAKVYCYAQQASESKEFLMVEIIIKKATLELTASFKSKAPAAAPLFSSFFFGHFLSDN